MQSEGAPKFVSNGPQQRAHVHVHIVFACLLPMFKSVAEDNAPEQYCMINQAPEQLSVIE